MSLFGPEAKAIRNSSDGTSISCGGASGVVYSKAFELKYFLAGALIYQFTSDGSVNAKIEIEQSDVLPDTEGSADDNYVVPEGSSAIDTVTDELRHIKNVSLVPTRYARLKITKLSGNDASTVLAAKLSVQQEI
jgi:hypothetical protein